MSIFCDNLCSAWSPSEAGSSLSFTEINPTGRQFYSFEMFSFCWTEICPSVNYWIMSNSQTCRMFSKKSVCMTSACAHTHTHTHTHTKSSSLQTFYETSLTISLYIGFITPQWVVFCYKKNAYPAHLPLDKLSELSQSLSWLRRIFLCLV